MKFYQKKNLLKKQDQNKKKLTEVQGDSIQNNKNQNNNNKNINKTNQNIKKMPPINVFYTEIEYLKKIIRLKTNEFLTKQINKTNFIIYSNNLNSYKIIIEILKNSNTNFYTFTPKEEKKTTLVLKGLDASYNENEVLEILKSFKNDKIEFVSINRLKTKRSAENNIILPHFIVQATAGSSINEIRKTITSIDNTIIYWENLNKRDVLQCVRCQRFSHSAVNCNMDYRCVKCGESHTPGECKITTSDDKSMLFCTLCKQHGHPASFKECPEHIKREKEKEEEKNRLKEKISIRYKMVNNYSNKNISYANTLRNNNNNNNISNDNDNCTNNNNKKNYNNNVTKSDNNQTSLEELNRNILLLIKKVDYFEMQLKVNTNDIKNMKNKNNFPNNN